MIARKIGAIHIHESQPWLGPSRYRWTRLASGRKGFALENTFDLAVPTAALEEAGPPEAPTTAIQK